MDWVEVSITTDSIALDAVSDMLMRQGAEGVSIEDGSSFEEDMKRLNWDYIDENIINNTGEACVKAYYKNNAEFEERLNNIKSESHNLIDIFNLTAIDIKTRIIKECDWQNEWKKYYKPFRIGKKILIKPSWEETQSDLKDIIIELDPGMAFGTGTHESTKMCAEFLERYVENNNLLLDIGCGSGILSIIGAKLGCSEVSAIDIDETAVKTTIENAVRNNVQVKINAKVSKIEELENKKYNIVCANIVADVIIGITPVVKDFLTDNGIYVVSGIIKERRKEVKRMILASGLKILEEKTMGEWVAIASVWENSL